ncbi:MAG: hypothetical protein Q8Q33_06735 [Chlamydiota bacterium]|nr:hypothetical protein [Chlamydiota bacterium]
MACFIAPVAAAIVTTKMTKKTASKYHLDWLNAMLWGGVIMLVVDHIAKGEISLYPPFLTVGIGEALLEILKVGLPMTLAVIGVWAMLVMIVSMKTKTVEGKTSAA